MKRYGWLLSHKQAPTKAAIPLRWGTWHSPGRYSWPPSGYKRDRPAGRAYPGLGEPMLLHGPLRVRQVRESVDTAIVGAAHPASSGGEKRKPVTGIGGGAGDCGELVHAPG